ncbi:hypothetical protein H6F88_28010 [Oculatella sp. FACHB-28]|uniref:hypothetical protein n=1 Tax=Oculatella sp. FACHB-28 TaxID=2692845 RepID=UPI001687226A|nr:hypothetical protein [Oculatella sp. FACHB-28]MBD2059786.1 hypothetical protein [Oculatella sp. FACHB-28]
MSPATQTKTNSHSLDSAIAPRSVRLLLALWFLGGKDVNQRKVSDRLKVGGKKSPDCDELYARLEREEAIEVAKKKVSITNKGIELLGQGLQSSDLAIEGTIVGSWMAKALLKWIQQSDVSVNGAATNGKVAHSEITSYEEFKPEALKLFEKLDKGYNYSGLVPIWHMRRELGDRVGRVEFSDWMMEMQAEQKFYLQGGEAREATEDQKRDSITNEIRGLLFFASKES